MKKKRKKSYEVFYCLLNIKKNDCVDEINRAQSEQIKKVCDNKKFGEQNN